MVKSNQKPSSKKPTKGNEIEKVSGEIVEESREAPQERRIAVKDILVPALNEKQLQLLVGITPPWAIKVREGKSGKRFKYVPHGYVTDTLNKVFGFKWSIVLDCIEDGKMYSLMTEDVYSQDKDRRLIATKRYIAVSGRLIVHDPKGGEIVKSGFGSQEWLPTMEFGDALKGARSDLIKTCAFQLGIALDLYYNEQAEYADFKNALKASASNEAAKSLIAGVPTIPVVLVSRVMNEYGVEVSRLCEIIGAENPAEIMNMNEKEISEAWAKVVKYVEDSK